MSINNKQWLGLPLNLLWGYIAIAVFMTGGLNWHSCRTTSKSSGSPRRRHRSLYPLRPGRRAVGVDLRRGGGNHHAAEDHDDWLRAGACSTCCSSFSALVTRTMP